MIGNSWDSLLSDEYKKETEYREFLEKYLL